MARSLKLSQAVKSVFKQGGWLAFKGGGARRRIDLTISTTSSVNYDAFVNAGSPTDPVDLFLTVTSSGTIRGLITGTSWHPDSTFTIINQGKIYGSGGAGGNGRNVTTSGFSLGSIGSDGGDAIQLGINVTIDNGSGEIFGGGGGGGGGGGASATNPPLDNQAGAGGGGGAGQGHSGTSGGSGGSTPSDGTFPGEAGDNGTTGNLSGPGSGGSGGSRTGFPPTGGDGGDGGAWGENGDGGSDGVGSFTSGGRLHGQAGRAIRLNGYTATFTAGNTPTRVKGLVA